MCALVLFLLVSPLLAFASSLPCALNILGPREADQSLKAFALHAHDFGKVDQLAKSLLATAKENQREWIKTIARVYADVAHGPSGMPIFEGVVGGKRVLDRLLLWLQVFSKEFAARSQSEGPKRSYFEILKDQDQIFHSPCKPEDVFSVFAHLQTILRNWSKKHPQHAVPAALIGGSFVNGKWRLGSDIDVTFSDVTMGQEIKATFEAEKAQWNLSIDCQPTFQPHIDGRPFYGKLNPFTVTPQEFEISVFEAKRAVSDSVLTAGPFSTYKWLGDPE